MGVKVGTKPRGRPRGSVSKGSSKGGSNGGSGTGSNIISYSPASSYAVPWGYGVHQTQGFWFDVYWSNKQRKNYCLTPYQIAVLNGLMLGDGYMNINRGARGVNPYVYLGQALHNFGFLWHAYTALGPLHNGLPGFYAYLDKRTLKWYYRVQFLTRSAQCFHPLYTLWYPHGAKILPSNDILIMILGNPITLAHWVLCDGGFHSGIRLSTQGFTYLEVYRIASVLSYLYGWNVTVQNKTYESGVKPVLYIPSESIPHLLQLITPYYHHSMAYKFGHHWTRMHNISLTTTTPDSAIDK